MATQTTEQKGAGRHSQHNERRGRQDRSVVSWMKAKSGSHCGSTVTVLHCIGSMNAGSVHFEFGDASSLRDSLSRGLVEVLFRGFGEREDGRQGALV